MKHINILITLCALIFAQMAFAANGISIQTEDGKKRKQPGINFGAVLCPY